MTKIITNVSKFSVINESWNKYSLKMEDKINRFLLKLKNQKIFSDETYNQLRATGSSPGILYGLPKVHKSDFKTKFQCRPIFAAYNVPSYNISKFLVPVLSNLTCNEYTVENSFVFCNELKGIQNSDSLFMASFDIENLFTNVPLAETISIILEQLFNDPTSTVVGLSKTLFKTFLEISVLNSFFIFNGILYKQIEGLGMGLPLGPTFANIFMCFNEKKWLQDCPNSFKPFLYRRFVDDTFLLFKDPTHVLLFQNYLNNKHSNIRFTVVEENSKQMPFLDVLVTRESNKFTTSVFRKNTFSGLGTSFFSFTPYIYKINAIKTLIFRAYRLSSNFTVLHREFNFIREYFVANGFPSSLVYRHIKKFIGTVIFDSNSNVSTSTLDKYFLKLPFFGKKSDALKIELKFLLHKYFPEIDFYVCFKNNFQIKSFFQYKDVLPHALRSSLIYKFSCETCSHQYIGSTIRNLYMRVSEHAGRSIRTDNLILKPLNSSIRDHKFSCNPQISLQNFKIINYTKYHSDLRILETMYIRCEEPDLNDVNSACRLLIE